MDATSINSDTIYRFTNGECGTLAAVMSQRVGRPMAMLCGLTDRPIHAVVNLGHGLFGDIEGVHTVAELYARWAHHHATPWLAGEDDIEEAVEAFYEHYGSDRPDWEAADAVCLAVEAMWNAAQAERSQAA